MPKISSRRQFIATAALLAEQVPNKFKKKMIKNIVLVHGTFADGSCYADVIRHLQEAGINAVAVQNPLTSLAADA